MDLVVGAAEIGVSIKHSGAGGLTGAHIINSKNENATMVDLSKPLSSSAAITGKLFKGLSCSVEQASVGGTT